MLHIWYHYLHVLFQLVKHGGFNEVKVLLGDSCITVRKFDQNKKNHVNVCKGNSKS